jgi:hypothetical protein
VGSFGGEIVEYDIGIKSRTRLDARVVLFKFSLALIIFMGLHMCGVLLIGI